MSSSSRVAGYEGLVRRMASTVVGLVADHDFDDLCQQYRLTVWRAIDSYDRAHAAGMTEYRYVLMCVKNREHDLRHRRAHRPVEYIEDLMAQPQSRDAVEARLLSSSDEQEFAEVEEAALDLADLSPLEARIVVRLYTGWTQADVARALGIEKNTMTRLMRRIRLKLDDWRPRRESSAARIEIARAA